MGELAPGRRRPAALQHQLVVLTTGLGGEEHDAEILIRVGHGQAEDPFIEISHGAQVVDPQTGMSKTGDGHRIS